MKEKTFVTHTCKNSKLNTGDKNYCFVGFIDEDKHYTTTTPPTWKYCTYCVKKGFKNPKTRKINLTEEQKQKQLENLKRGREERIKKLTETNSL